MQVLGGSSCLNHMMYVRGDSSDYDSWQKLGATGWGWKDVLPYFLKMENYQGYVDYEMFEIHILIDHHFNFTHFFN